jgi:hypothetical protein
MPAIKVYKHNGVMIPVDSAKTAKAYICPWTGELYATKRSYVGHLKKLREQRMHKRARIIRRQRKLEDMWNQPDFESIIKWIHINPEVFWENAKRNGWHSDAPRWDKIRDSFSVTIKHLSVTYSESVSNSHNRPHNGVTNWGGRETLKDGTPAPRGYPGFSGRIEFQTSHEPFSFASNIMEGTRIHTGSGGGGGNNTYRYDVKFFLDDWPGLKKTVEEELVAYEKKKLMDTLSRKRTEPYTKSFSVGKSPW